MSQPICNKHLLNSRVSEGYSSLVGQMNSSSANEKGMKKPKSSSGSKNKANVKRLSSRHRCSSKSSSNYFMKMGIQNIPEHMFVSNSMISEMLQKGDVCHFDFFLT